MVLGATCDQDLYDYLYHTRKAAFKILPRSNNLQTCGFCQKHMLEGKAATEVNFTSDVCLGGKCSPSDIVVVHGNCGNGKAYEWKLLIYQMARIFYENQLKVVADDHRIGFAHANGSALSAWPFNSSISPTCKGPSLSAFDAWNDHVCNLFRELFRGLSFSK